MLYLNSSVEWVYVQHADFDIEGDKFDRNNGDIICKKLGYSSIKSTTKQPCNFNNHWFIKSLDLASIWCSCICVQN